MPEDFRELEIAEQLSETHIETDEVLSSVVWPLVDHCWRDDWRANSYPDNRLVIEKMGKVGPKLFRATLVADTGVELTGFDDERTVHEVGIHVDELLSEGSEAKLVLASLAEKNPRIHEVVEDTAKFNFLRGTSYFFDEDGDLFLDHYSAILDKMTNECVVDDEGRLTPAYGGNLEDFAEVDFVEHFLHGRISDDSSDDDCPPDLGPDVLRDHDLEHLENGVLVFKAPRAIIDTLNRLRAVA